MNGEGRAAQTPIIYFISSMVFEPGDQKTTGQCVAVFWSREDEESALRERTKLAQIRKPHWEGYIFLVLRIHPKAEEREDNILHYKCVEK